MRIRVVSMWFCEEQLARFFLKHYAWADEISILVDADTSDGTWEILREAHEAHGSNLRYRSFDFPHRLDDILKARALTEAANEPGCDWAIVADADEFVFAWTFGEHIRSSNPVNATPVEGEEVDRLWFVRDVLEVIHTDIVWIPMWNVYRHRDDDDLDPSDPALPQRRHGSQEIHHVKPCIFRVGAGVELGPVSHSFTGPANLREVGQDGLPSPLGAAHWQYADPDLAVERLVTNRKNRLSPENLARGHGAHYLGLTEGSVRAECAQHLDDPRLF